MNAATLEYIREHAKDDVCQLALRPVPADVDLRAALTQIEGRQLATHKLPTWAATDGLLYPQRLALEQCSSEATAAYKRQVVESLRTLTHQGCLPDTSSTPKSLFSTFLDLTGGLGVDFVAIAPAFARAIYVEQQQSLCDIARHNFTLMSLPDTEVHCASAEDILKSILSSTLPIHRPFLIFLDPARRDIMGHKVARIEDCTPDVCAIQDQLQEASEYILIKLSPMLDLTAALQTLHGITESHVVSVNGECKELLLLMQGNCKKSSKYSILQETPPPANTCPIHCIDLSTAIGPVASASGLTFTRAEEAAAPLLLAQDLFSYLYEPNASILKAGAFKTICQRYPVRKLAPQAHLYTSQQLIPDFPGRIWRITDSTTFSKQNLRRMLSGITAADLTVRGFPVSVATLRKKLNLREGGQIHLIATTLDQQRLLLRVERINLPH